MIQQKLAVLSKAGLSKDDFDETETKHLQVGFLLLEFDFCSANL